MGKFEEVLIIVLIILLLFGAKKIPDLARSIGQSAKEVTPKPKTRIHPKNLKTFYYPNYLH